MRADRRVLCSLLIALACAAPAAAQQKEPIGPVAVDLRAVYARHKAEPSVATDLGVNAANLPSRSFGLSGGFHLYPLRSAKVTLGIGGNVVMARGSQTLDLACTWSRKRPSAAARPGRPTSRQCSPTDIIFG